MAKKGKIELVHKVIEQVTTDSMTVGDVFGKEHFHVIRDIRELGCSEAFMAENFVIQHREQKTGFGKGRVNEYYEITRDGFFLLAMGYTGQRAMQFKEAYIGAFNAMERELRERASALTAKSVEDMMARVFPVAVGVKGCSPQSRGILGGYIRNHPGLFVKWRGQWRATKPAGNVLEKRTELQTAVDEMEGFEPEGQLRLFN